MVTPEQISTFSQYIQALKPHINPVPPSSKQYQLILTQYHQVPTSTAPYWPSNIMNQPVMLHTDPILLDINQLRPILSQYHQVWTSSAPYWPSTTKYQPVLHNNDPVPSCINQFCSILNYWPSTNQYRLLLTQYHHISYSNIRLSFVNLRWAQLYVSLVSCL